MLSCHILAVRSPSLSLFKHCSLKKTDIKCKPGTRNQAKMTNSQPTRYHHDLHFSLDEMGAICYIAYEGFPGKTRPFDRSMV